MLMQTLAPFAARIDRKSLADALKLLAKVVEKRNTIPILSCVLLVPGRDQVTVRGTDLDLQVSIELPAHCQPGRAVAVDLVALKAAVGKAKAEGVLLADMGGGFATFRDGETGATMRMSARDCGDFPIIAMGDMGGEFAIDAATLASDLSRVRVAVSTEETRYYLNGVFFHRVTDGYGDAVMRMVATDGHRMARIERPVPVGMPDDFSDAIVPRKMCDVALAMLNKRQGDARLAFNGSKVRLRLGRVVIESKLVDGTFPDYSRVIPSQWDRTVTLESAVIADAAKSVMAHLSSRTRSATFSWDAQANWMTASAFCPDNGPAMMMVYGATFSEQKTEGGAFAIGVNGSYLAELMTRWDGQPVTLACSDANCPVLITGLATPEYLQVLMPMRIDCAPVTPEAIERLHRSPVETFVADAPAAIAAIALEEGAEGIQPSVKARAVCAARRHLAGLVQGAIAHRVAAGQDRRAARLAVLAKLAQLRGDEATFHRLLDIAAHAPGSSFLAWSRDVRARYVAMIKAPAPIAAETIAAAFQLSDDSGHLPDAPETAPVCVAEPAPATHAAAEPEMTALSAPAEPEPVIETSDEASARIRSTQSMFRSLQDFKARAGQGTRWTLENYSPDTGWGGLRTVTVATVRARDVGFLRGQADLAECQKADVRGFGGRTWIGFPSQGDWESDAEGLVTYYKACPQSGRASRSVPMMRIRPVLAPAAVIEPQAGELPDDGGGELAALRSLIAAMGERLAALENASQASASESGVGEPDDAESALVALSGPDNGNSDAEAMRDALERAEAAELRADLAEAKVQSLTTRNGRLMAVLAGTKRKLVTIGRDLLFARTKAATLQRDLDAERARPAVRPQGETVHYNLDALRAG